MRKPFLLSVFDLFNTLTSEPIYPSNCKRHFKGFQQLLRTLKTITMKRMKDSSCDAANGKTAQFHDTR